MVIREVVERIMSASQRGVVTTLLALTITISCIGGNSMAAPSIQQPLFDSQNELKRCSKCKAALSRDQFYKNSARCDGLDDRCKSCREVCNQKNAHSPAARAARARYKKKTEVKVRYNMQRRERRVNDPVFAEKEINRQRQWRRDNIEQARARRRDRNQTVGGRFSVLKSNAK